MQIEVVQEEGAEGNIWI